MIEQFRVVWNGQCQKCRNPEQDNEPDGAFPPRSEGRVARWALERAAAILQVSGRTRLRIADTPDAPFTPHEHSLDLVANALAEGDAATARAHAQWLVKPEAIRPFLRALEPVTQGPARLVRAA
ncbi:MAG: hypothetical protein WA985_05705 [Erythrobacter sp.]